MAKNIAFSRIIGYNTVMNILKEYKHNGIYVKHAADDSPRDSAFPMHIHQNYEIYLFIKGKVKYLVEGSSYPLYPGSILIIRPNESHKPKILESSPYERFNINFHPSVLKCIDPEQRLLSPFLDRALGRDNMYSISELGDIPVRKLFFDMCYAHNDTYASDIKILTNLLYILDALRVAFDMHSTGIKHPKSREEEMVAYVNEHLSGVISVPILAEHFYMSPSQFSRIFKSATGASPWEYISIKRLSNARDLIRSGESAQQAFCQSGYGDYSAFYRAYLRHFGYTPTDEKKKK